MQTTPKRALTYPDGSDPIRDGASHIAGIAQALDGVPKMVSGKITLQFGGGQTANKPVTFPPNTFSTTPEVFVTLNVGNPVDGICFAYSISTTGATLGIYYPGPRTGTVVISYLAIGS